jgi:glycosyltransferase involved in cell wall biosynthesis
MSAEAPNVPAGQGESGPGLTALRVCVVGSGTRFLSGISIYTVRLANALAARHRVTIVTMRGLLPRRFYPGRERVGQELSDLRLEPGVKRFDGIDWFWFPSLIRGLWFVLRNRPQVMILQWWTGTVLHTYLALSIVARLLRMRLIIEFHEVLDTGEANLGPVRRYVGLVAPIVVGLASGFAVHSAFDEKLVRSKYRIGRRRPIAVLPHGPHDHYRTPGDAPPMPALREAPAEATNLLFFGVIRPYKGLEDLVLAFDSIPEEQIHRYWLTVVGETWEGWALPGELIAKSRYRHRITFVNRYVHDNELDAYLRGADAVILPYRRSSLSGPLHVAMGYGLPIVMTDVGGNAEAAQGYGGTILVPAADPVALRAALERLGPSDVRHAHPHSWRQTAARYEELFAELGLHAQPVPDAPNGTDP